ncbi:MAG: hypothetical protein IJT16_12240 [Lachnospiraceae bacterium]|nr:hypothetical protein [Lachnospiraceae bacterium]
MEFEAGNYERYCSQNQLRIVQTPHEHDLMMDDESLDVIVPELLQAIEKSFRFQGIVNKDWKKTSCCV